jgi:hypothetical protein
MSRVGCWPCIFSRKSEIRLLAELDPKRIDELRELEMEISALRRTRNVATPGRYKHTAATFFMSIDRKQPNGIDSVVEWSKTARGGRQLELIQPPPGEGCFRWGMCEPPGKDEND